MKRTLILMLVLSCLIAVDGCKKDKNSSAGSGTSSEVGSSASAQSYSGPSVEELENELIKVMADFQAGKISGAECEKRMDELSEQRDLAMKATAAPVTQAKKAGSAKMGTLHIINIPATAAEPGGETSGVVEEKYEYKAKMLKVHGVGELTLMGTAIKELPGKYPPVMAYNIEIATDTKRVQTPNGDSITVSVLMAVGTDEYIDFEDATFQQVMIHWNPPENISHRSCLLYCREVIFKNGVGTADCKSVY